MIARPGKIDSHGCTSRLERALDSSVNALVVFDDGNGAALYAGGLFTNAGGLPLSRVGRFDGAWSALAGHPYCAAEGAETVRMLLWSHALRLDPKRIEAADALTEELARQFWGVPAGACSEYHESTL